MSLENIHFEGPEKILEVAFTQTAQDVNGGLRSLPRSKLDEILRIGKCEILSKCSNKFLDSYVLSESSLFVYPDKVVIKTCGTITLLLCLQPVIEAAKAIGYNCTFVSYSRKDFKLPEDQLFPHKSFSQEVNFTSEVVKNIGLSVTSAVLGDFSGDHCCVLIAYKPGASRLKKNVVNVMMYDLSPDVSQMFHLDNLKNSEENMNGSTATGWGELKKEGEKIRHITGIDNICGFTPETQTMFDDTAFFPCGYSMNSLNEDCFSTVHVTPEQHCCYASFETDKQMSSKEYDEMLADVLKVFQPERFTITFFADKISAKELKVSPVDSLQLLADVNPDIPFAVSNRTSSTLAGDYVFQLANYIRMDDI